MILRDATADAAERLCSFIATTPIDPVGRVTASIGVAELEADGSAEEIYGSADVAMYRAKERGRNTHQFFTPALA